MSTIHPTRPLSELRNHPQKSCHQQGICQNPYATCKGQCEMPIHQIKLRQPTPLPNLDAGVLDGPYRSGRTQALRERRQLARALLYVGAVGLAFWAGVAYVVL